MNPTSRNLIAIGCCFSTVLVNVAPAQSTRRTVIEQALTENTRVTLEQVPLRDAIASITEQTGVELHMTPEVMALVPGGGDLVIQRVDLANLPLRDGLDQLFAPLGMTWRVHDDGVHVEPRPAIRCLGRAPTWSELDLLAELSRLQPSRDASALSAIRDRVQFRVPVPSPWSTFAEAIRDAGAGSADEVLSVACDKLGWSWCLSGEHVVITPREQDVVRRLNRPLSLRVSGRPLFDVIMAVGDAAGVSIRVEPGALVSLSPTVQRSFTLELSDQTGERALEMIAAYTGLGYLIEPDGVLFYSVQSSNTTRTSVSEQPTTIPAGDPYVGRIVVPLSDGTTIEWLIRYSELPTSLRERRAADLRRAFEAIK